jgi:GNAT superfamily N-acetyltransferase
MKLTIRKYQSESDYWKARAFLREVFLLNDRRQLSWDVCRFDYWRWHGVANIEPYKIEEVLFFWETPEGRIAAMLNPEGYGSAFLHIHPQLRTPGLEEEMISIAEERLTKPNENGRRTLRVWAVECNRPFQDLLVRRSYAKSDWPEYMRYQSLEGPILDARPAPGYTVRALNGDNLELLERCYASGLGFHEGDINIAVNNRSDPTWYQNIQNAPLYRRDLDIVAIAPDGSIASFCTVWFDDVCRIGIFEPVATVPTHQRKGLGKAVMSEGLRRLVKKGATKAFVGSYSVEAGALYASAGFSAYELNEPWVKEL